ncbi:MAG TPA: hypothetical protein PLA50_03910 [Bacteroidia bacterium]|nr:hypothetical protein [Bacteroidia bacterium]
MKSRSKISEIAVVLSAASCLAAGVLLSKDGEEAGQVPASLQVDGGDVGAFVAGWMRSNTSNDPDEWVSDFDSSVDYCYHRDGPVGKPYLRAERLKLIAKYPNRSYRAGDMDFYGIANGDIQLSLSYTYDFGGSANGKCVCYIVLRPVDGRLLITSLDERVLLGETPDAAEGEEAVARLRPQAPASPQAGDSDVEAFVAGWMRSNGSNDPDEWVSNFDFSVNYCYKAGGPADKPYLREDRLKLIAKYPDRSYRVGDVDFHRIANGDIQLNLSYYYDYGGSKNGKFMSSIVLRPADGRLLITSFNEKILRRETSAAVPVATLADVNSVILRTIGEFPQGGGYNASRKALDALKGSVAYNAEANRVELRPKDAVPSFCSGATYLALVLAIRDLEEGKRIAMTPDAWKAYQEIGQADGAGIWGRWNANGPGTAKLFAELNCGTNFTSFERAMPGDFMKIWWTREIGSKESGHSVIYLGRSVEKGEEMVRFWSSNIPGGFGEKSVPMTSIKRVLFSRLTSPEKLASVEGLPRNSEFLASMLNRPAQWEEVVRECNVAEDTIEIDVSKLNPTSTPTAPE